MDLLNRVEKSPCVNLYDAYWKCLSENNNYFWKCRSFEKPFNQCINTHLVIVVFFLYLLFLGAEKSYSRHARRSDSYSFAKR